MSGISSAPDKSGQLETESALLKADREFKQRLLQSNLSSFPRKVVKDIFKSALESEYFESAEFILTFHKVKFPEHSLQNSIIKGKEPTVSFLLKHGESARPMSIPIKDGQGLTPPFCYGTYSPMSLAAFYGHEKIAELLMKNGAWFMQGSFGMDHELQIASDRGHVAHIPHHPAFPA